MNVDLIDEKAIDAIGTIIVDRPCIGTRIGNNGQMFLEPTRRITHFNRDYWKCLLFGWADVFRYI